MPFKLGSVFWSTDNVLELGSRFEKLGFNLTPSNRYPQNTAIYFGPDGIEFTNDKIHKGSGVQGVEFDTDDIVQDYNQFKARNLALDKAQAAKDRLNQIPLWYGFHIPDPNTPGLKAWVVMDSPEVMKRDESRILPVKHPNTAFGLESVTYSTSQPENFAKKWAEITRKPCSQLNWNELEKTSGYRVTIGDKFLDAIPFSHQTEGVCMLTIQVTDLEKAKASCHDAGIEIRPCATRDGFIAHDPFLGSVSLRFVRAFWKRYLPMTRNNFPYYRREDKFRPLGGSYTSTLVDGFADHWEN